VMSTPLSTRPTMTAQGTEPRRKLTAMIRAAFNSADLASFGVRRSGFVLI